MGVTGHHLMSRSIVWFSALVVMVFAAVDLTECHGRVFCFVMNIGILIMALFGVLGAWRNDKGLLGWFVLLVFGFIGMEIGFVIWAFVENYGVRTVLWNLILIGCLFILAAVSAHARNNAHETGDHYAGLPA